MCCTFRFGDEATGRELRRRSRDACPSVGLWGQKGPFGRGIASLLMGEQAQAPKLLIPGSSRVQGSSALSSLAVPQRGPLGAGAWVENGGGGKGQRDIFSGKLPEAPSAGRPPFMACGGEVGAGMQAAAVGGGREQSPKSRGLLALNLKLSGRWDLAERLSPQPPALQGLVLGRSSVNICWI